MAYQVYMSLAVTKNYNGRIVRPVVKQNCVEVECYGGQRNQEAMRNMYVPYKTRH
jgi:hypothetical protein